MYKEKINWWWFLFVSGVLLPGLMLFNSNSVFLYNVVLYRYFIAGLNPFVGLLFNFLLIGIITIGFKAIGIWLKKNKYAIISYVLLGLICLVLFLPPFIFDHSEVISGPIPRRYIDTSDKIEIDRLFFAASYFSILVVFLIFYVLNFPRRLSKNGPQVKAGSLTVGFLLNSNLIHFTNGSRSFITYFTKKRIFHF